MSYRTKCFRRTVELSPRKTQPALFRFSPLSGRVTSLSRLPEFAWSMYLVLVIIRASHKRSCDGWRQKSKLKVFFIVSVSSSVKVLAPLHTRNSNSYFVHVTRSSSSDGSYHLAQPTSPYCPSVSPSHNTHLHSSVTRLPCDVYFPPLPNSQRSMSSFSMSSLSIMAIN